MPCHHGWGKRAGYRVLYNFLDNMKRLLIATLMLVLLVGTARAWMMGGGAAPVVTTFILLENGSRITLEDGSGSIALE